MQLPVHPSSTSPTRTEQNDPPAQLPRARKRKKKAKPEQGIYRSYTCVSTFSSPPFLSLRAAVRGAICDGLWYNA